MKRWHLIAVGLAALLVSALAFAADDSGLFPDAETSIDGTAIAPSSITTSGNLTVGGDIIPGDDIYADPMASDAAASPTLVMSSRGPFRGVGAANTAATNLVDCPETGANNLTGVTKAGTTGDTVRFLGVLMTGGTFDVTITEGDGTGGTYECDGAATDAACVDNLVTTLAANATLGPILTVAHTVGQETAAFFPLAGTACQLTVTPSDAVNTVIVAGTAGMKVVKGAMTVSGTIASTSTASSTFNSMSIASNLRLADTAALWFGTSDDSYCAYITQQTPDAMVCTTSTDSNNWIFAEKADGTYDFAHAQQTNPTLWIQSANQSQTEWGKLTHDQTNFVIASGTGGIKLNTGYLKGQTSGPMSTTETVTFAGGAGDASKATTALIPDGAFVFSVTGRVVTAGTTCTTCNIGDGTDADMFAAAFECDVDTTTFTNADATAQFGMSPATAAKNVTITAVGGNCVNLVMAITASYFTATAATAD